MPDPSRIVPGAVVTTITDARGVVFSVSERDREDGPPLAGDPEIWFPTLGVPDVGTTVVVVALADISEAHQLLEEPPEDVRYFGELVTGTDRREWYDAVNVIRQAAALA